MALNTEISWCDHTLNSSMLGVNGFVAFFAKCKAVGKFKSQFRIISKWFDMVSTKIPAAIIPTVLASEFITEEHTRSPLLVFFAKSYSPSLSSFAIFVHVTFGPAVVFVNSSFADFKPRFKRVCFSSHWGLPRFGIDGELRPVFFGMPMPLECGYSSLVTFLDLYASACLARRVPAIKTSIINVETFFGPPLLALHATLEAEKHKIGVILRRYSSLFRAYLHCAFTSLCHA